MMTTQDTIKALWSSGFVNRWHSHPDPRLRNAQDTTAAHSQRVAILVDLLYTYQLGNVPRHLITTALYHDAAECATGDTPAGAKRSSEYLDEILDEVTVEWQMDHSMYCGMWDSIDNRWVKMCDLLDAILFVKHVAPDLLEREDWQKDIDKCTETAGELSVSTIVKDLIHG